VGSVFGGIGGAAQPFSHSRFSGDGSLLRGARSANASSPSSSEATL